MLLPSFWLLDTILQLNTDQYKTLEDHKNSSQLLWMFFKTFPSSFGWPPHAMKAGIGWLREVSHCWNGRTHLSVAFEGHTLVITLLQMHSSSVISLCSLLILVCLSAISGSDQRMNQDNNWQFFEECLSCTTQFFFYCPLRGTPNNNSFYRDNYITLPHSCHSREFSNSLNKRLMIQRMLLESLTSQFKKNSDTDILTSVRRPVWQMVTHHPLGVAAGFLPRHL